MKLIRSSFFSLFIIFVFLPYLSIYSFMIEIDMGGGYESWQLNSSYYEKNSFLTSFIFKIPFRLERLIIAPTFGYRYSKIIKYPTAGFEIDYLIHPDYMPFLGIKSEIRKYNLNIEGSKLNQIYSLSFVGGSKIVKTKNEDLWLKIELLIINSKYKTMTGSGFYIELGVSSDTTL